MSRKDKYRQIAELAEWVNENRVKVAEDGMSVIIGIADTEKIRRLCLTGQTMPLWVMLDHLRQGAADEFDRVYGVKNEQR